MKIDFSNKIFEACLNDKTIIRSTILASSWSEWLNFLLFLIVYLELHEKNSIYSLCQNSTQIVCHLNVQGILWSNIWMYVIVCLIFFIEKQSWSLDIFAYTVSFDLSKLFYCLRQVLIHFVLNVCFSSNHILQISLAFSKREMSWLCWILKKWKLLGYCMNLLLDLLNFEWKKNMCLYNACIY